MNRFEYGFFDELSKLASEVPTYLRDSYKRQDKRGRRDRGDELMAQVHSDWTRPDKKDLVFLDAVSPEAQKKREERFNRSLTPDLGQKIRQSRAATRRIRTAIKDNPNNQHLKPLLEQRKAPMPIPEPAKLDAPSSQPAIKTPNFNTSPAAPAVNPNPPFPQPTPLTPAPAAPQAAANPGWSTNKKLLVGGLGALGVYGLHRMFNSNRDKEREKTAANNLSGSTRRTKYPFNMSGKTFRTIGLGLAATPLAAMGASKLMSLHAVHKNKQFLKEKNPGGVASHPLFEQQFDSLKRFSPRVAADPLAASHALHKMQHSSSSLLDILKDVHQLHTEEAERRVESRGLVGETGERLLGGMG